MRYLIIIALAMLIACDDDEKKDSAFNFNDVYIPLHLGNQWHFQSINENDTTIYKSVITDYVKKGDHYYYEMTTDKHYKSGATSSNSDIIYLRTPDGINYYCFDNNQEYIYRTFKDTTISEGTINNLMLKSRLMNDSSNVSTPIGKFYNNYLIEVGDVSLDKGLFEIYSKEIGLIELTWFRGKENLIYAKINGVEYDKI